AAVMVVVVVLALVVATATSPLVLAFVLPFAAAAVLAFDRLILKTLRVTVARAKDVDDARVAGGVDRGLEHARWLIRSPALAPPVARHAEVLAAVLKHDDVVQALDRAGARAGAVLVKELAREHLRVPAHADDAEGVVADRRDRSGGVRAVARVILRV